MVLVILNTIESLISSLLSSIIGRKKAGNSRNMFRRMLVIVPAFSHRDRPIILINPCLFGWYLRGGSKNRRDFPLFFFALSFDARLHLLAGFLSPECLLPLGFKYFHGQIVCTFSSELSRDICRIRIDL
jgi:hypothetical protein